MWPFTVFRCPAGWSVSDLVADRRLKKALQFGWLLVLAAPVWATAGAGMESPQPATYAVLSNGFRIRYARHEAVGASTRLFLANDTSTGYVDVPTSGIVYSCRQRTPFLWQK